VSESIALQALGTETVAMLAEHFSVRGCGIPELYMGKQTMGAQMAFLWMTGKDEAMISMES